MRAMRIRSLLGVAAFTALAALSACNKPSEAECQKAIDNINKLHGKTVELKESAASVRSCRSSSHKETVACMIAATSIEQLTACEAKK
jgi:hypothetical protein